MAAPGKGSHRSSRRNRSAAWDAGGIAGTVLRLCSDLAAFTTGANIVVDGGQTT
ncbi:SDR family oxidoreductase [Mesorhizobium sp. M0134]|uniref:SDR family oxidoreductase n=1 Tax=Mesorhizobium sp. M0134 TaxID=2956889 RepID=UPI003336FF15